jgi:hypothetical protein
MSTKEASCSHGKNPGRESQSTIVGGGSNWLKAKYDGLEKRLAEGLVITMPTITVEGDANSAPYADCFKPLEK